MPSDKEFVPYWLVWHPTIPEWNVYRKDTSLGKFDCELREETEAKRLERAEYYAQKLFGKSLAAMIEAANVEDTTLLGSEVVEGDKRDLLRVYSAVEAEEDLENSEDLRDFCSKDDEHLEADLLACIYHPPGVYDPDTDPNHSRKSLDDLIERFNCEKAEYGDLWGGGDLSGETFARVFHEARFWTDRLNYLVLTRNLDTVEKQITDPDLIAAYDRFILLDSGQTSLDNARKQRREYLAGIRGTPAVEVTSEPVGIPPVKNGENMSSTSVTRATQVITREMQKLDKAKVDKAVEDEQETQRLHEQEDHLADQSDMERCLGRILLHYVKRDLLDHYTTSNGLIKVAYEDDLDEVMMLAEPWKKRFAFRKTKYSLNGHTIWMTGCENQLYCRDKRRLNNGYGVWADFTGQQSCADVELLPIFDKPDKYRIAVIANMDGDSWLANRGDNPERIMFKYGKAICPYGITEFPDDAYLFLSYTPHLRVERITQLPGDLRLVQYRSDSDSTENLISKVINVRGKVEDTLYNYLCYDTLLSPDGLERKALPVTPITEVTDGLGFEMRWEGKDKALPKPSGAKLGGEPAGNKLDVSNMSDEQKQMLLSSLVKLLT